MFLDSISWYSYFMDIAEATSRKSKDPTTKVGAIIVDSNNRIVSTGYNGMPSGILETVELWKSPKKYDFVLHAELNAIVHCNNKGEGLSLYTTMFPCKECAKVIAAVGIKYVYYRDQKYDNKFTREIFNMCGIKLLRIIDV